MRREEGFYKDKSYGDRMPSNHVIFSNTMFLFHLSYSGKVPYRGIYALIVLDRSTESDACRQGENDFEDQTATNIKN